MPSVATRRRSRRHAARADSTQLHAPVFLDAGDLALDGGTKSQRDSYELADEAIAGVDAV